MIRKSICRLLLIKMAKDTGQNYDKALLMTDLGGQLLSGGGEYVKLLSCCVSVPFCQL